MFLSRHAETSSSEPERSSRTLNFRLFVKRTDFQQFSKSALVKQKEFLNGVNDEKSSFNSGDNRHTCGDSGSDPCTCRSTRRFWSRPCGRINCRCPYRWPRVERLQLRPGIRL